MSSQPEPHSNGFRREWEQLAARERRVMEALLHRKPVTRDVNQAFLDERSFGQRMADRIAAFGGSWPFILTFLVFLTGWMALNTGILQPRHEAFDPYPYILLNLILSTLAALQAPVIMMSQNRHAAKDRLAAEHDYDVNLKAEIEIMQLHDKLDEIRTTQLAQLLTTQQEQLSLLTRLVQQQSLEGRGRS